MDLLASVTKKIEVEYLRIVSACLKNGEVETPFAKQTAQEFLKLLPFSSLDDIHTKLNTFITTYPQFKQLNVIVVKSIEEHKTKAVIEKMRTLLKEDKIDAALELAKS